MWWLCRVSPRLGVPRRRCAGLPRTSNISPDYIRSSCVELDPFYVSPHWLGVTGRIIISSLRPLMIASPIAYGLYSTDTLINFGVGVSGVRYG